MSIPHVPHINTSAPPPPRLPAPEGSPIAQPAEGRPPGFLHGGLGNFARRHLLLIVGCAALGVTAAAFFSSRITPLYRAKASVRIDSRPTQLPTLTAMGLAVANPLLTEIEMLRSRSIAGQVAESLGIDTSIVYRNTIVKRRSPDADIVDVSVLAESPELARNVANALVAEFIAGRHDARQVEAGKTAEFLRQQADRVAERLASAESELRSFREREGVVNLAAEATSGVTRRADIEAQRNAIEAERAALQSLLNRARRDSQGATASTAYREVMAFPTLLRSPASALLTPLLAAEDRLNDLLSRRTREDPDVKFAEARIAQLHGEIQTTVSNYLQGLTSQVQALNNVVRQSDAQLASVPGREITHAQLEREARNTEGVFSMLQQRLQEAEIAAASTDQSVRLVDAAGLPSSPETPKPLLYMTLAAMAGAMLGLAGALYREHTDNAVRTRREVLAATSLSVLGIIPHLGHGRKWGLLARTGDAQRPLQTRIPAAAGASSARRLGAGSKHGSNGEAGSLAGTQPAFQEGDLMAFREAYVWLATNLRLTLGRNPVKSILITSALPGEGKTTVAVNLAMSFADDGQRVLLIDGDLRAGRVGASMRLRNTPGLTEFLSERMERERPIHTVLLDGGKSLDVVPAGGAVQRPTQLLSSRRYRDLLDWAKESYDAVVIDAPPMNSVADAAVLARNADGVLFVARSGVSEYPAIAFAMEQLRASGASVLGAVLNDADFRRDPELSTAYEYYGRYKAAPVHG